MTKTRNIGRDLHFLDRALRLASKAEGEVAPNPMVGAVIVNNDYIVGEGFHRYDGMTHAEVLALKQAGQLAKGGTAYINLEPCCHSGRGKRTPSCVEALIAAKVKRVVCCTEDPNPRVAGKGFAALRAAGIEVSFGLKADEAYGLNAAYFAAMSKKHSQIQHEVNAPAILGPIRFHISALGREVQ